MAKEQGHPIPAAGRSMQITYAIRDIAVPAAKLEAAGKTILKLNIGDPLAYPGFPVPEVMLEAYERSLRDQHSGYAPSYGTTSLREAIAADEHRKGNAVDVEDVYVTAGVTEAILLLSAACFEPGDRVLVPGPHYPPYLAYPSLFGAEVVEYGTRHELDWQPDLDDLRQKLDERVKMVVVINPNNPTGSLYDPATLKGIAAAVADQGRAFIACDEIYDEITFESSPVPMATLEADLPLVILNGVSKNYFAPGWRIGYAAFRDPHGRMAGLREGFERLLRARLCAPSPAMDAYEAGLRGDQDWRVGYVNRIQLKRDLALATMEGIEGLESACPGGAFYMFPRLDLPPGVDDRQFALDLLQQELVLAVFGSGFSRTWGSGFLRLVYLLPDELLEEAIGRIGRHLARIRRR
jgi:aspartate/methionine/tyrosine aminotransferase